MLGALRTTQALLMLVGAALGSVLGERLGVLAMFDMIGVLYVCAGVTALALIRRSRDEPAVIAWSK